MAELAGGRTTGVWRPVIHNFNLKMMTTMAHTKKVWMKNEIKV